MRRFYNSADKIELKPGDKFIILIEDSRQTLSDFEIIINSEMVIVSPLDLIPKQDF